MNRNTVHRASPGVRTPALTLIVGEPAAANVAGHFYEPGWRHADRRGTECYRDLLWILEAHLDERGTPCSCEEGGRVVACSVPKPPIASNDGWDTFHELV